MILAFNEFFVQNNIISQEYGGFPNDKSGGRVHANYENVLNHWKQANCVFFTFSGLSE